MSEITSLFSFLFSLSLEMLDAAHIGHFPLLWGNIQTLQQGSVPAYFYVVDNILSTNKFGFVGMFSFAQIKVWHCLPCLKGGGFCEAKDGGILHEKLEFL